MTDTPKNRETDYGRVDDHSSAIRSASDPRRTLNRLPDYPVTGAGLVDGEWDGATVSASSSASDATQLGTVLPGASPAAAVDGDKDTSWVSSGLDHAVGQWLQFDLPRAREDLAVTVTVGRALGPAVTRLMISTEAGTVYSDPVTAGTPITLVAPSDSTRWLRITAAETANRSWGNQFAISEARLTDARTDTTIPARHDVVVPGTGLQPTRWVFGQDTMGRSGCVVTPGPDGRDGPVQCADIAIGPEEPGALRRTVNGPGAPAVTPTMTLRARPGQALSTLLGAPSAPSSFADAAVGDGRGNGGAASDGDPNTVWTAPQSSTDATAPKPVLRLRLPAPQLVTGLTLALPRGEAPARPTQVGVDLGTGRQVRDIETDADTATIALEPAITDSIAISLLDWDERINVNTLGFPEKMAAGLADVSALGPDGAPVPGSTPASPDRPVTVSCESGPSLRIGDRTVRFRIESTARSLRDGAPVRAVPCESGPLPLPGGRQQVVATPGDAFSVETLTLDTPEAAAATPAATTSPRIQSWTPDRRIIAVTHSEVERVLVVPESRNSGWAATAPDGTPLRAVTVNGWQQGWVVPPGVDGNVTLRYSLNATYRIGLFGGLMLLLILASLALTRGAPAGRAEPVQAWQPAWAIAGLGIGAVSFVLSGWPGLAIWATTGAATAVISRLQVSEDRRAAIRVFCAAGFTAAGMLLLATGPWHAESGYVGHGPWPQGLALAGILIMAWSAVPPRIREPLLLSLLDDGILRSGREPSMLVPGEGAPSGLLDPGVAECGNGRGEDDRQRGDLHHLPVEGEDPEQREDSAEHHQMPDEDAVRPAPQREHRARPEPPGRRIGRRQDERGEQQQCQHSAQGHAGGELPWRGGVEGDRAAERGDHDGEHGDGGGPADPPGRDPAQRPVPVRRGVDHLGEHDPGGEPGHVRG
ncbi:Coagulation factor 5/8 type domain protein OS=Tsukamurella paurometabola (strain ATCC 8368 / DSM/ CCUG 35730 / CIP 100753 / JCM 10117 / KCTC 9821 / NBRC 16120 / NCIMB 702349 / NCTC 13040) OX=521096 GN=Tpau_0418 PE=4 SV=1 [Tsukamurella paurometabola]